MTSQLSNLACDLSAIDDEQREEHQFKTRQLFEATLETQELANGFAFPLPLESSMIVKAAEFIAVERLCCPFFNFVLELEPDGGPLWLRITGSTEAKQILAAELTAI